MAKFKTKYIPMPCARFGAEGAVIVGKELDRIAKQEGAVKPEIVVTEAKPADSPLHPYFTWTNSEAAEKWRLEEARSLIRSVRIIKENIPAAEQRVIRAFVNIQAADTETAFEGSAYLPIKVAVRSEDYKHQLLDAAKAELNSWKRRYEDMRDEFTDLHSVFAAIDEITAV